MRLGIGIGTTSPLCLGRNRSPGGLFKAGDAGFWLDPSAADTLAQDAAGSNPVTAFGQPVGFVRDRSGRGLHATQSVAGLRPLYARVPAGGLRNLAHGSAAVGNTVYWDSAGTQNGTTTTRLGSGVDVDGLPYVDVRYSGTPTAQNTTSVYRFLNSLVPAAAGSVFTASCHARRIAGTLNGVVGFRTSVIELDAALAFLTGSSSPFFTSDTEGLVTVTRTLTSPSTAMARTSLTVNYTVGVPVDVTFRIKALQFEAGAARTAFQTSLSPADVTEPGGASRFALLNDRTDDALSINLPAGGYTIAYGDDAGVTLLAGQVLTGAYPLPNPARLYGAVGINRALNEPETAQLLAWLHARRP